jgi:hypothetical protein
MPICHEQILRLDSWTSLPQGLGSRASADALLRGDNGRMFKSLSDIYKMCDGGQDGTESLAASETSCFDDVRSLGDETGRIPQEQAPRQQRNQNYRVVGGRRSRRGSPNRNDRNHADAQDLSSSVPTALSLSNTSPQASYSCDFFEFIMRVCSTPFSMEMAVLHVCWNIRYRTALLRPDMICKYIDILVL